MRFMHAGGLHTLTHADTAGQLWRAGLSNATLCGLRRKKADESEATGQVQ
jgi:hypothetical protein